MKVVRTCSDLEKECTGTVAQTGFLRKEKDKLHEGHSSCIKACKENANLSLVTFFPHEEIINWLYDQTLPIPTIWDETYCLEFCEQNGVDIVFIPSYTEIQNTFFLGTSKENTKTQVNNVISAKSYDPYAGKFMDYIIGMEYLRKTKNLYPKDVCVFSVKEGYKAFIRKNYYEVDLLIPCVLVDLVYRPDGLPYSSSLDKLNSETISLLSQIYKFIYEKTYNEINQLKDSTILIEDLNKIIDTNKTVSIDAIRMWKEGLVEKNKLILELSTYSENQIETLVFVKEQINDPKEILQ